jgi:hypothetical protein
MTAMARIRVECVSDDEANAWGFVVPALNERARRSRLLSKTRTNPLKALKPNISTSRLASGL